MHKSLRPIVALVLACAAVAATADGDPAAGRVKFETCRGCHAIPGYANAFPNYHVPRIAGQHAARIAAALTEYRAHERSHPTMIAQASSLSDADIQDIAAYLAAEHGGSSARASAPATAPEKAAVCAACHGQDGNSPSQDFPILAGQHADYLRQALESYRGGARSNPIMGPQAKGLSDAEIRALAAWFASQHGPLATVP